MDTGIITDVATVVAMIITITTTTVMGAATIITTAMIMIIIITSTTTLTTMNTMAAMISTTLINTMMITHAITITKVSMTTTTVHTTIEGKVSMPRRTEQRDAIRDVFQETDRPLNAQEVLEFAQEQVPGIGIATVYRNIKALIAEGWIVSVDLPNEPSRYELADLDHHHHFQCTTCQRVFDVPGCTHGLASSAPAGFEVEHHEVLLYGTCPDCTDEAIV